MKVTVIVKAMNHQKLQGSHKSVVMRDFNLFLRHLIHVILIYCNLSLLHLAMVAFLC
jgi:hypothetical protein